MDLYENDHLFQNPLCINILQWGTRYKNSTIRFDDKTDHLIRLNCFWWMFKHSYIKKIIHGKALWTLAFSKQGPKWGDDVLACANLSYQACQLKQCWWARRQLQDPKIWKTGCHEPNNIIKLAQLQARKVPILRLLKKES